ncbi:MAG: CcmD family protein [Microscillaceae bacterium]|nr:CcmD family protein [Microscillaceae bacterium]
MKKCLIFFLIFLQAGLQGFAQSEAVEMADTMRANGKIYVVVAVLGLILLGLFAYLFRIEQKVSKIEKLMKD